MKKLLFLASAVVLSAGLFGQQSKADSVIKFKETSYDFGKIKQSVPVTHDFNFSNVSNSALIIESATASCGCTTPTKPEGAVAKGKEDKITAGFNAAVPGPFNKTIFVKVTGVDTPIQLKITGEVLTADAYSKYQAEKTNSVKTSKSGS